MDYMGIKYNPEIHDRVKTELVAKRLIEKYVDDCVEAGICPKCGKKLMVKFSENKEALKIYCGDRGCTFVK